MKEEQRSVLISFYKKHRRMPSYSEMAKIFGYKSKNAVARLVDKMVSEGVVSKDGNGRIIPNKLHGEVKVLGLVEAGFPSASEEEVVDTMSIDDFLIDNKESTYLLRVKGDSMIDAGIHEGDLVLVERGRPPREGDIVIAEIDSGWTMKYFRRKAGRMYLEPANKKYSLIFPTQELKISAIVKAVIRKY